MKYRVTVSNTEERVVEAPNAFEAARRAANGDRSTIIDVKAARGRAPGSTLVKSERKPRKPMSAATKAKLSKNLAKARAVRKRNVAAAKKAARSRKR